MDHAVVEELRDVMAAYVGVVRDGAGLARALAAIKRLRRQATGAQTQNMLTTALLIASAAFARRESRGAHFRSDFPDLSPEPARRSRLTLSEAEIIAREATA
jgi:L-aspartate oxidase